MAGFQPTLRPQRVTAFLLGACVSLPSARAAEESTAEALFREGRRLLASGQIAEACDKFAESQREEPSSGALLNLARCHAEAGMSATASAEYLAAAHLARAQDRLQQAQEAELRAAELRPRLMYLQVQVDAATPGVVVTRNGVLLAPAELTMPIPVDPGNQTIRAVAAGYADWTTTVLLTQPGQVRTVAIPALAPLPSPHAIVPAHQSPTNGVALQQRPSAQPQPLADAGAGAERSGIPVATRVAASIGTATLASSAVLAWIAKSKWDDAHDRGLCNDAHMCNAEGIAQTDRARQLSTLATAGIAVSAVAFTTALVFYASAASSRKAAVRVDLGLGRSSAALGVRGDF